MLKHVALINIARSRKKA